MKILHTQAALFTDKLYEFERCGRYEAALAELRDIWEDTTDFPNVEGLKPRAAAEIFLRCGSLIGFLGHNKQLPSSQEKSKNLLTAARNRFLDIYDVEKIAECENYLALAYWRTGELVEAEAWIEESLSHNLPNSNFTRLYCHIIKSKIDFANSKYELILENFKKLEGDFLNYADDCLKGDFYNHIGLALKNIGKISETLKNYKLARDFYQKAGHQIYLGTVENNRANLYKSENKFIEAHKAIDSATKIFKQVNDKTREGFSLDTKAQIYFAERKYEKALKSVEKAIDILTKSENQAYLVQTLLTKTKTLIFLDDFSAATFCLFEAVQIAKGKISEEVAKNLVKEFEKTIDEKNSTIIEQIFLEKEDFGENLELILPPALAHYNDVQGVWIKNDHLEAVGLRKDSLAIVVKEKINRGDLVAISEIENDSVSCGFYDFDFGIVCLEGVN
jgi:tetratricopeptide (TPR) repeat protein